MTLKWAEITDTMRGELIGTPGQRYSGVSIDSRQIQPGNLYFALSGQSFDGHQFAESALSNGASAVVVVEGKCSTLSPRIVVSDPLIALQQLGGYNRHRFTLPVFAITGSHGKTTTKDILAAILKQKYPNTVSTFRNLNGLIGVPLTLAKLSETSDALVVEVGISEPGEMARLAPLVQPTTAIFTCVAMTHTEFLPSLKIITREKQLLLENINPKGRILLNGDDEAIQRWCQVENALTYGFGPCDFQGSIRVTSTFETYLTITPPQGNPFEVRSHLPGKHNASNILAACAAAYLDGISVEQIQKGLMNLTLSPHRSQIMKLNEITLIDDTYNAAPKSMKSSLEMLLEHPGDGRKIAVLGDMLELGEFSDFAHEALGNQIAQLQFDAVFLFGTQMKRTFDALALTDITRHWFPDNSTVAVELLQYLQPDDVVLFKASRSMRGENILEAVQQHLTKNY